MASSSSSYFEHVLPFTGYSHESSTIAALDLASAPKKKALCFPLREERPREHFATVYELRWIRKHLPAPLYALCLPKILKGEIQVNFLKESPASKRLDFISFHDRLFVQLQGYGKGPQRFTWINGHALGQKGLTKFLFRRLEVAEITEIYARTMEHLLLKSHSCARAALLQSLHQTLKCKDRRVDWNKVKETLGRYNISLENPSRVGGVSSAPARRNRSTPSLWRVVNVDSLCRLSSIAEES